MSEEVTRRDLAAKIVVEGCVPMIEGKSKGQLPIKGLRLTSAQRGELGMLDPLRLKLEGETIFYPVGAEGVFLDLGREIATVWFNNPEARQALQVFEKALNRAYPKTRYIEERKHPEVDAMRVRFYIVDLEPPRLASIEVSFPETGSAAEQFVVRVRALMKPN